MKKKIEVENSHIGQRLDRFVKERFFQGEFSRGEVARGIKEGKISIKGKAVKPSHILRRGDVVEIDLEKKKTGLPPNQEVDFKVIYEDENFVALEKPAGLQVHPGAREEEDTLVNGLVFRFPEIAKVGDEPEIRPGIVHRLDRETSGVMVVALNQKTFLELKRKFQEREIEKTYQALVYGRLEKKTGLIEKPLARSSDYKKQVVAGKKTRTKIRPAVTAYRVVQEFQGGSLVEVFPKTGRMHQIRVHLNSIGHPIVGDKTYFSKKNITATGAPRQMLHAKSLKLELFKKKHFFEVGLPEDFVRALALFRQLDEKEINE